MRQNLHLWLNWLDAYEGGFANRPQAEDPGGATMRGITLATYERWCAEHGLPKPTVADLMALSDDEQDAIAAQYYWNPIKGDALPGGVDMYLADFKFMSGRAVHVLQSQVLGFTDGDVDGWVGPKTLAAIKAKDPKIVLQNLHSARLEYYRSLPNWAANANGWTRRCVALYQFALDRIEPATLPAERPPIKGRTFWGAVAAGFGSIAGAADWVNNNNDMIRQVFASMHLDPAWATAIISMAGFIGACVVIYARYSDYRRAKEAQVA